MTDEMMVQAQKPSPVPYLAGGALAGAAIGGASAKYGNFGIPSPKYSSWEQAIKDSNDEFVKKQAEKDGDKKADWQKLQTAQKEVAEAEKKVTEAIPEKIRDNADVKDYLAKVESQEKAEAKALKDIEDKIKKGEMKEKVSELVEDDAYKAAKTEFEDATKAATIEIEKEVSKDLKGDELTNKAKELLEKTNKEVFDKGADNDEYKKALAEIEEKITKGEMKETVKELAEDDAYKAAKAKFETATEKATKEVEKTVDKELKGDDLKNKVNELFGKNKPEEVTKAEKATEDALEKAKKVEGFADDIVEKVKSAREGVKAAKDKAKATLTDDLLKGLKSASTVKTAIAGAALLGLLGYLFAPKGEKV